VTGDTRPNPDALLAAITSEAARRTRGQLKVFLGMCPGVGKTYAMLEAAHRELASKRDVVIGYVETHGRAETDALAAGIPTIARKTVEHRSMALTEMDLDAVLARRPALALVDELAHSNAPGSRHPKRWQDVQELLDAGVDVFTTLNVQHLETRADTVRQITGSEVRETVPDSVLDDAVLELVDLPPTELLQRLKLGKVYLPDRANAAAQSFFREGNLTALREIALRLVADHVGQHTREFHRGQTGAGPWKTGHSLLVAVGPGPLSEPLIRWTRRLADGLRCRWLAVHVEGSSPLPDSAQSQLTKNLSTARELGAEVFTTTDDDLVRGLLRVAREQNVTQIIVGKPGSTGWFGWWNGGGGLLRRLTRESGDIDLHVVRAEKTASMPTDTAWMPVLQSGSHPYLFVIAAVGAVGILNLGLAKVTGPRAPGLIYLLAVVLLALKFGRGPVLVAGALSALAWNFFFLPPRFEFTITNAEDAILFGTYFVVALVLGQLVARIRAQERAERRREERTAALYELTRDLAEAGSRDEVVWQLVLQMNRVFNAPTAIAMRVNDKLVPHPDSTLTLSEKELGVADWACRHRQAAGRFTDNLPGADALHLPLITEHHVFGALAVGLAEKGLANAQRTLLEAFARQAALVLDRVELRNAAEQARLSAESDRLSRALLDSISHELRTPLAASDSAASALAAFETAPVEHRRALIAEIQEANARLNRIVGNLLDVARLESGKILPKLDWHDARDVIHATLRELSRELGENPVHLDIPTTPMLVKLDFALLQHTLANLLLNAVTHTPKATPIEVQAQLINGEFILNVGDRGPGIPPELMPRIFDKFFRSTNAPTGGSGLGLTIAKGFVTAHGGTISVLNRPGGGALFTLRLPPGEMPPHIEP
jgi:two-component system sensor histidine kinase KdpD